MYYLLILQSSTLNKFYIEFTCDDIEERLRRHNSIHKGLTGGIGDWKIVYTENYQTKTEAYAKERQVKSWKSRKKIEELIKTDKLD